MFDNIIHLTLDGGVVDLVRVNQDKFSSNYRYRGTDLQVELNIRHTSRKDSVTGDNVDRHNVEVVYRRHFSYMAAGEAPKVFKTYFVLETPGTGDAAGELNSVSNALKDTFMTNDFARRLANWES